MQRDKGEKLSFPRAIEKNSSAPHLLCSRAAKTRVFGLCRQTLVKEIVAVNHAWKEAKKLFNEPDSPLANSLRDLKTRLQVRLLRTYAPERVFLVKDTDTESEEELYGKGKRGGNLIHQIS